MEIVHEGLFSYDFNLLDMAVVLLAKIIENKMVKIYQFLIRLHIPIKK